MISINLKNTTLFESSSEYSQLKSSLDALKTPAQPKPGFSPPMPAYKEPEISLSQKLLFKKRGILKKYQAQYDKKMETWRSICERNESLHAARLLAHEQSLITLETERESINQEIIQAGHAYELERIKKNEDTDILQINYQSKQPDAVQKYFELVLFKSDYPAIFPKHATLEYHKENHTLYISMELPHPDLIPREKEIINSPEDKKEIVISYSKKEFVKLYNDIIYKIILKTFHELFSADKHETVDAINFSGWVKTLNRGNGQFENTHIASLFASREMFAEINLKQVDPEICFKYLKGISGPVLCDLKSITVPFTLHQRNGQNGSAKKILEPIDNSTNLANMVWREFEKNIMDLFQKEFDVSNADVKLIHSALETGLEAIAEDPDPIRGGKILFHAKRSIKPIPVSAIRELFGSVIHEAAIKGIIVTTADFTPEAYEFAKNKPLRLVNGSSLLGMFEKQGRHMRINLREAVSLESWLS